MPKYKAVHNPFAPLSAAEVQDRLFQYFSTGVEDVHTGVETGHVLLHSRSYKDQLQHTRPDLFVDSSRPECFYVPSWYILWATRKMAPGSWYVHRHNKDIFRKFTYGTTYCGAQESIKKTTKHTANCELNMTDAVADSERVLGFAYSMPLTSYGKEIRRQQRLWSDRDDKIEKNRQHLQYVTGRSQFYGKNAIYFKSDAAIEVYHNGDHDWQIIFPLCSEYDVFTSDDAKDFPGGVDGLMDYYDKRSFR